jgi:hypothetical protein
VTNTRSRPRKLDASEQPHYTAPITGICHTTQWANPAPIDDTVDLRENG